MVCAACGLVVGYTEMIAALPVGASVGRSTDPTPGVLRIAAASFVSAGRSAAPAVCATTVKGPLKPGPKAAASRSYALRVVEDAGLLPSSDAPRRSEKNGIASNTSTTAAAVESTIGRRSTSFPQAHQRRESISPAGPSLAS